MYLGTIQLDYVDSTYPIVNPLLSNIFASMAHYFVSPYLVHGIGVGCGGLTYQSFLSGFNVQMLVCNAI